MWVVPKKGHLDNSDALMGVFSCRYPKWWMTESTFDFRLGFVLHPYVIPIHTDGPLTSALACKQDSEALMFAQLKYWSTVTFWPEAIWEAAKLVEVVEFSWF